MSTRQTRDYPVFVCPVFVCRTHIKDETLVFGLVTVEKLVEGFPITFPFFPSQRVHILD